jgi:RNA recognition motif-containing protein
MSKKIYVGNMSYSTTEQQLTDLFSQFGTVQSVNIVVDRYTNQAKGFGFVEMEDDAAEAAISALNGKELGGRQLKVNEAMNKRPPRHDNNRRY